MPLAHVAVVCRAARACATPLATRSSSRRAICYSGSCCAKEFAPSPYDGCRPDVPDPTMHTLRVGGYATQAGSPLAPDALDTPAVWAYRVEHGIYRLGVSRDVAASLGGIEFVDVAEVGSVLTEGRPIGMVEGAGGMLGLVSSLSGEVVAVNTSAVENPTIALALAPTDGKPWPERGWLAEIDGYLETGDNEDDWEALPGYYS